MGQSVANQVVQAAEACAAREHTKAKSSALPGTPTQQHAPLTHSFSHIPYLSVREPIAPDTTRIVCQKK